MAVYYGDNQTVLCRDYQTATGVRVAMYQWWLLGFVSGAGHGRPMARVDVAKVLAMAADHCQSKPSDTLGSAAVAVFEGLRPAK